MREYNPDHFRIHDQALIEIETLTKSVDNKLFNVGIHYLNKITGQIKNDRFYQIRDSISLRTESLIFHYKMLNSIHNPSTKIVTDQIFHLNIDLIPIYQKYLFDSIIFNSLSMIDYLSCLINLVIEKNKDKWKRTWHSLENHIRNNPQLCKTKLGIKIIEINKDWVSKLNEYRAELIHYQSESLSSKQSFNAYNRQLDVLVLAPQQLKKYFKELKGITEKQNYNINSVSLWIINVCIEVTIEALNELDNYIEENRIIPDDKAIFSIVKK
jgi:hypothetical protein